MSRFIPDDPVAIIINYKRRNNKKSDYRAFTIDKEDTYNYDKFIDQITVKFKLERPFNDHYILKYRVGRNGFNRVKVKILLFYICQKIYIGRKRTCVCCRERNKREQE